MSGFAELVAATNYSFLRGASHPSDMVGRALELGIAHAFLMAVPPYHKVLVVTDAAINIAPALEAHARRTTVPVSLRALQPQPMGAAVEGLTRAKRRHRDPSHVRGRPQGHDCGARQDPPPTPVARVPALPISPCRRSQRSR